MKKNFEIKDILFSSSIDGESEFFPLLSDEDEQKIDKEKNPRWLILIGFVILGTYSTTHGMSISSYVILKFNKEFHHA
mgnify:CR=1 FL=1